MKSIKVEEPSSSQLPQLVKPSWKKKRYAPRMYNKEKNREYYNRFRAKREIKLFEVVDIGPVKSIVSFKDKHGVRWFSMHQLLKTICDRRFRQTGKKDMIYGDNMKNFEEIELPPLPIEEITSSKEKITKTYAHHKGITKNTKFIDENGLPLVIIHFARDRSTKNFFLKLNNITNCISETINKESSNRSSLQDQAVNINVMNAEEQSSIYEYITVESFKNIGVVKDLNNTSWFNLADIYRELSETKFNQDKKQIFDKEYILQLKDIPLTVEQWTTLKKMDKIKDKAYFVNEIGLNTLGGKLILLANRGAFPMAETLQQSQHSQPSTSTAAPQEQELSITTTAAFVQKQLSTLCDQYIQHITNPLIPFNVLPVLEYSQNLHAITDRSNEDDVQERPEVENENEETGNDEPSREDQDSEQQQIVVKYQREDCRYEHVIPRTYEGDTGFFILLRINHRPGAYYVLRAQYKSLPGRFSILNRDLQRFPLGLTELLRIVTANPMRLLGHVAKRYESKVRRYNVTILELIESEDEQTEPTWTEAILMEKIQALHEELVMSVDDVPQQPL